MASGWCLEQTLVFQNKMIFLLDVQLLTELWKLDSWWIHRLYSPWNFPGQNTRVGSLSLLQGIFPTQGLNPGLLHYQVSHKGSAILTGVGSLLLLWQIVPSQESNQCLLHCRQILYQLSNQGSPFGLIYPLHFFTRSHLVQLLCWYERLNYLCSHYTCQILVYSPH